jgi:hypothetical protein
MWLAPTLVPVCQEASSYRDPIMNHMSPLWVQIKPSTFKKRLLTSATESRATHSQFTPSSSVHCPKRWRGASNTCLETSTKPLHAWMLLLCSMVLVESFPPIKAGISSFSLTLHLSFSTVLPEILGKSNTFGVADNGFLVPCAKT